MSSSKRFSEAELESMRLWESPDFFNADGSINTLRETQTKRPGLTVDEIEQMQQQAYDEAFKQGQREGHAKGYEEGLAQGITTGQLQGHSDGLAQGLAEGLAKAEVEQRQLAAEFTRLMTSLSEPFSLMDETVEQQLVALAIAIASQLVRREIKQHPGEIMAVVRAAVAVLPVAVQKLTLYLHPADAEIVRSSLALTQSSTSWELVEDPLMTQGGCKVATDVSFVDATIEKRLAAVIAKVLGDEREHEHDEDASR